MFKILKTSTATFLQNFINFVNFSNYSRIDTENVQKINFLKKNGYLDLGTVLNKDLCKSLSERISYEINIKNASYIEKTKFHKIDKIDSFVDILDIILNRNLINLISSYFRKKIYFSDFDLRRIYPVDYKNIKSQTHSPADWHKDTRGSQLKIMVYITNVTSNDNYFSFIPGSHFEHCEDYLKSRYSDESINNQNEIKWIAEAGSAMLFDTNIIHRLNRKLESSIRDSFTFYFTIGQHLHKIIDNKDLIKNKLLKKLSISNSFISRRY